MGVPVSPSTPTRLNRVRVRSSSGRVEEDRNSSIGCVFVRRLELKTPAEMRAQAAAQVVHGAVGQRDVRHFLRALGGDRGWPETRVDMDCLESIRVPSDAHGSVAFHAAILTEPVPLGALWLSGTTRHHQRLP
jgi:hypothetical protein